MSLWLSLWTLRFCSLGSCLGFGRYISHFIIALCQDKIVIIHFSCRYLAAFYQWWDSIQRMKSCTLFHSWLVLWHGHRSFKLTPLYSLMRFRIKFFLSICEDNMVSLIFWCRSLICPFLCTQLSWSSLGMGSTKYVVFPTTPCVVSDLFLITCGLKFLINYGCSKQYGCSLGTCSKEYFSLSYLPLLSLPQLLL